MAWDQELLWLPMGPHHPEYEISHRGHIRLRVARKSVARGHVIIPSEIDGRYYYTLQDATRKSTRLAPKKAVIEYFGRFHGATDKKWATAVRRYAATMNNRLVRGDQPEILYKGKKYTKADRYKVEVECHFSELRSNGVRGDDPQFNPFPPPPEKYLCCREPLELKDGRVYALSSSSPSLMMEPKS